MGFIRMFLALVVVTGHFQFYSSKARIETISPHAMLGMNAGYALMFFFAISGFLMSVVLATKYEPTKAGTLSFYRSRFIRIYSLYWPLVALLLLVPSVRATFNAVAWGDRIVYISLIGTDWRLLLPDYPALRTQATLPPISQAWALSLELTFYLIAPFLLRSWKTVAIVLVASVAWRIYMIQPPGQFNANLRYVFFPAVVCFFLMGHAARLSSERLPALKSGWVGLAMLAISILSMTAPGPWVYWDTPRFWLSVCAFSLALPGIFAATKDWRVSNVAGDLSYGVYLIHIAPLLLMAQWGTFAKLAEMYPTGLWRGYVFLMAYALAMIALAYLVHTFIEKPVARGMRSVLSRVGIQ